MVDLNDVQMILDWYAKHANELEMVDSCFCLAATAQFAEQIKPIYDKYTRAEKEGFKIIARIQK